MASLRYIVPALAIAGSAAAATCSVSATATISNAADGSGLATCQTFTGSIAIATSATDSIDLSGIQEITGSLVADTVRNLPGISSSTLETIQDTFLLSNLTTISTLNFPKLTDVNSIDFSGLGPNMVQLGFSEGIQMASNLSIQNTYLTSLSGINLETVDTVNLANNNYLGSVNMQLGNVTESMIISSNGKNVSAIFPNLMWANYLEIKNVSTFSVPSLQTVNTSMYFNNDYFSSVSAPNLTSTGQDLSFVDCTTLTNLSFPLLTSVGGGLTINNTGLTSINAFPKLSTIGGALDYQGNFTNASLPSITAIQGAFNVQSESDLTDTCNKFSSLSGGSGVIHGQYVCNGSVSTPTSGPAGTSGTTSGGAASSSSHNAAAIMIPAATTGFLGVVAAIFGML